jgi:hypothetical protein
MKKMIQGRCLLWLLLLILVGQASVQTTKIIQITMVETGELLNSNFQDEKKITAVEEEIAKTKGGEKWLGLYVKGGGSSLIESNVKVKPLLDPKDGKVIGKVIGVDQPGKPVFLVKGAAMLKPGPAPTIYLGGKEKEHELIDTDNLTSTKPRQLKLGNQEYQLKALALKVRACPKCLILKLALVSGQQTQTICSEEGFDSRLDSATWRLLWAGDADGDGKLDLYVGFSSAGLGNSTELFLSSQAKPGEFVKSVATFETGYGR